MLIIKYIIMTREEKNARQRFLRKQNNNANTRKYEKTKKGFLVRCYRNMLSRVTGVTKSKNHLYLGLDILDKQLFYDLSINDCNFNSLFDEWEKNKYERRLTPSIDRIDSKKGYIVENIRWVTFSENCKNINRNK